MAQWGAVVALPGCGGGGGGDTTATTPETPTQVGTDPLAGTPKPADAQLRESGPNNHYQYPPLGPSDFIDVTRLPAAVAWNVFVDNDATRQVIARSARGAMPADGYVVLPVYGTMNVSAWTTPMVVGDKIKQMYGALGDDILLNILPGLRTFPLRAGPRGVGTFTAYTTWHGHTSDALVDGKIVPGTVTTNAHVPWWVGVVVDGTVGFAFRNGSVAYPYKIPLESYCFDFTFYEPRRTTFFAVDSGVGKVLAVDREDTRPFPTFTTSVFAEGFGKASSIRAIGDKLYIADNAGGAIWELTVPTKSRRKVCDLPGVWFIDSTSTGDLLAVGLDFKVHPIQVATGRVGANLNPFADQKKFNESWVYISVDRFGTCGPVDSFLVGCSHGSANIDVYRFSREGVRLKIGGGAIPKNFSGPADWTWDPAGHYPWVCEYHPSDGAMLFHGFANICPNIVAVADPARVKTHQLRVTYVDPTDDVRRINRAQQMIKDGGEPSARGVLPSFTCQMNVAGWSYLGVTTDHVASMSYPDAAAFIRAGMLGSTQRTIGSEPMRDLLFYLYYNSQRHLREGASLIQGLMALPTV